MEPEHVERVFRGFDTGGKQYTVSMLTKSHPKYAGVKGQFVGAWRHSTVPPTVVRIFQVRNSQSVHSRYIGYRDELEMRHGFTRSSAMGKGNEVRRFHGTASDPACSFGIDVRSPPCVRPTCAVCRICSDSFDVRFAGSGSGGQRMALRYGKGLYFSSTSSKSNDYATGSEKAMHGQAHRLMFLSKVAQGAPHICDEEVMSDEAIEDMVHDQGKDSVVGRTIAQGGALNHDELVVYKNEAAVPSYLIVYKF